MTDELESGPSPQAEIERLELYLEQLADDVERCRKFAILARVMVWGSAAWIAAGVFGLIGFGANSLMVSLAVILTGFIVGGSNRSTLEEDRAKIAKAEARRNELIGAIDLRTVRASMVTPDTPGRWLH